MLASGRREVINVDEWPEWAILPQATTGRLNISNDGEKFLYFRNGDHSLCDVARRPKMRHRYQRLVMDGELAPNADNGVPRCVGIASGESYIFVDQKWSRGPKAFRLRAKRFRGVPEQRRRRRDDAAEAVADSQLHYQRMSGDFLLGVDARSPTPTISIFVGDRLLHRVEAPFLHCRHTNYLRAFRVVGDQLFLFLGDCPGGRYTAQLLRLDLRTAESTVLADAATITAVSGWEFGGGALFLSDNTLMLYSDGRRCGERRLTVLDFAGELQKIADYDLVSRHPVEFVLIEGNGILAISNGDRLIRITAQQDRKFLSKLGIHSGGRNLRRRC